MLTNERFNAKIKFENLKKEIYMYVRVCNIESCEYGRAMLLSIAPASFTWLAS